MEPGFVVQKIITVDKFCGSTLDLLQAYNVIEQPGFPELAAVTQVGADQRQVEMQAQRR